MQFMQVFVDHKSCSAILTRAISYVVDDSYMLLANAAFVRDGHVGAT
jgi:hypothetical protein